MYRSTQSTKGFTVVELIVVIVLLGILSGVAMSRSVGADAFEGALAADFVAEELRYARRLAQFRQGQQINISFTTSAGGLSAATAENTTTVRSREWETPAALALAGNNLLAGQAFNVTFDASGNVSSSTWAGGTVVVASGVELEIVAENSRTLCLYSTGFTDAQSCR